MASHEFHSFYYDQMQEEPVTDDFTLPSGTQMTPKLLRELIDDHRQNHVPRYQYLEAAHRTHYRIFGPQKNPKPDHKPDNRLAADMAFNITQTFEGFFIGVPIDVKFADDEAKAKYLADHGERNNQDDVDADLSEMCSKFGHCYEMFYQDDEGKPRSAPLTPMCSFIVYDDSVLHRPMYFVRYVYDEDGRMKGSYSDPLYVTRFEDGGGGIVETDVDEHYFGDVPVAEYMQNSDKRGLYEGVLNLVEAYNKALSEKANDVEYFSDAYMVVKGTELPDNYKDDLRKRKLINLFGDDAEHIDCFFLAKPDADATQENLVNRLEMLIFKMAMVPDITDESFSTASGIALKMRLMPMGNLARKKELKFKASIKRRLQLLANYPDEPFGDDDWMKVEVTMHRNMPEDLASEAAVAGSLSGIVSEETQLSVLSCVDDPKKELERKEKEKQERVESLSGGYPTNRVEGTMKDEDGGNVQPTEEAERSQGSFA